jgi:acyl carrier protein
MMDDMIERLKTQIVKALNLTDVKPEDIDIDQPLIGGSLGLDSIDTLELLVMMEKEYGVRVPDVNVGRKAFASVRALATYITEQTKKKE